MFKFPEAHLNTIEHIENRTTIGHIGKQIYKIFLPAWIKYSLNSHVPLGRGFNFKKTPGL
jgi:hypothetical protein